MGPEPPRRSGKCMLSIDQLVDIWAGVNPCFDKAAQFPANLSIVRPRSLPTTRDRGINANGLRVQICDEFVEFLQPGAEKKNRISLVPGQFSSLSLHFL